MEDKELLGMMFNILLILIALGLCYCTGLFVEHVVWSFT